MINEKLSPRRCWTRATKEIELSSVYLVTTLFCRRNNMTEATINLFLQNHPLRWDALEWNWSRAFLVNMCVFEKCTWGHGCYTRARKTNIKHFLQAIISQRFIFLKLKTTGDNFQWVGVKILKARKPWHPVISTQVSTDSTLPWFEDCRSKALKYGDVDCIG